MEIELNRFTPAEQATFRLRALYEPVSYTHLTLPTIA